MTTNSNFIFPNMSLPFFFFEAIADGVEEYVLTEDTSKHIVQVLRMTIGDQLLLTDGKGNLLTAAIKDDHRKRCVVKKIKQEFVPRQERQITIAISPLKNNTRLEWMLEKATEVGVGAIIPLMCKRTEKQHLRTDRLKGILVSAMLQSKQAWLCELSEPTDFSTVIKHTAATHRFIAHCEPDAKSSLREQKVQGSAIVLIGPEGDFTHEEIREALDGGYSPVSLGETRLRTETAGLVAAVQLCVK